MTNNAHVSVWNFYTNCETNSALMSVLYISRNNLTQLLWNSYNINRSAKKEKKEKKNRLDPGFDAIFTYSCCSTWTFWERTGLDPVIRGKENLFL